MKISANSETGCLRAVLLGFIDDYKIGNPVNSVQRYYYRQDPPCSALMTEQYESLAETFENHGVRVYRYDRKPENMDRPFVRDAIAVIDDTLFICSMKNRHPPNIKNLLAEIESPVIQAEAGILEGGDIILDKDILYLGMGERTDAAGFEWLKRKLGHKFEIQPVHLTSETLHLDIVFNLAGKNIALIYSPAFEKSSLDILRKRYRLFDVSAEEQFALGINIVSLTPETVISEKRAVRINAFLKKEGLDVIMLDYSEVSKLGGAFRCSTCPLIRDRI